MMKKFNILYESLLNTFKNDGDFKSSILDNAKFDFKKDDNSNITCLFTIRRNGKIFNVNAKYFNSRFSFTVTSDEGDAVEMTEKEFAVEYYMDYEDFKNAFKEFQADEEEIDDLESDNGTKVKPFSKVLELVGSEDGKGPERTYEIGGVNFMFRKIADDQVPNYCECLFQDIDPETNEQVFYKALVVVKNVNSVIVKIITFDDKGGMLEPMTNTDFKDKNPDLHKKLLKAINKMGRYVSNMLQ